VFSYIVFSCLDIPVKHSLSLFIYYFKNSLIIHEENTKKNHKRDVSLYICDIDISLDLHKL
jgi:hypothetical protein